MSSARWQCWRHGICLRSTRPSASSFRSRSTGLRSASGLRCSASMRSQVVGGVDESAADHRRRAEPRARGLLLLAVDPLRVLAERRLHARRLAQRHLVDGPAPALQRDRLAADRIARARVDVNGEHAAANRVAEAQVGRVNRVDGADLRGDRLGHFVGVLAGPAFGLLAHSDVRVRIDEAGQDPRARGVDHLSAVGNSDGRADRRDPAVLDQHRSSLDLWTSDRNHPAADNSHRTVCHLTSLSRGERHPANLTGPTEPTDPSRIAGPHPNEPAIGLLRGDRRALQRGWRPSTSTPEVANMPPLPTTTLISGPST